MLVSVLVCTSNSARFIRQTIHSVLAQTFDDFEIVVVDGGSLDNTCELVAAIPDSRIRLIRREQSGIPAIRNFAVQEAQGEFLAHLGAHDLMDPFRLEVQVDAISRIRDVGVVHTNALLIDRHNRVVGRWDSASDGREGLDGLLFREHNIILASSTMVRRQVYDDVGLYDEGLQECHDLDFWIRAAKTWRFLHLPLQLIKYRRCGGSVVDVRDEATEHDEVGIVLERIVTQYRTLRELVPEVDWGQPDAAEKASRIAHDCLVRRGHKELADRHFAAGVYGMYS